MNNMHVVHINFAKGFRGGERQTLNLIEGLASRGVRQTLVCRTGSELAGRGSLLGIGIHAVPHPVVGHAAPPGSGINHVHEARGAYWAAIERSMRGTPYLITRRIPNPVSQGRITRLVYRHAARLVGVSNDVSRRLGMQIGQPVQTILDSCSSEYPDRRATADIRHELGDGPIIGHVGALHDRHKGQSILISAFKNLVREFPTARLVLVGDGPDRELFENLARGENRIVFAGFQKHVSSWIAAMDVFVFPSREEGLGSSVLDAMKVGVPVIASTVGGLPELTGAGERGMVIEGDDPNRWEAGIRTLLNDSVLQRRLVDNARSFAAQHELGAMADSYLEIYKDILAQKGTPS